MTIIGLGHMAGVGKDSAAAALVERHGFVRVAFADPLRTVVYETDREVRTVVDRLGWEDAKRAYPFIRQALEAMGESVRRHVHPDAWVFALLAQLEPGRDYVISDVRYPNEAKAVREAGGIVARIDRPGVRTRYPSDMHLLGWEGWDAVIENDGTLDDLAAKMTDLASVLTSV